MQTLVEDGIVFARSAHGIGEAPCRTDLDALLERDGLIGPAG